MSGLSSMLRAVLLDPADDLARLAYADACEEAGDGLRAEFVRLQAETGEQPLFGAKGGNREHCLLMLGGHAWLAGLPGLFGMRRFYHDHGYGGGVGAEAATWNWERGFIAAVRCPLSAWLEHAEAICRAHPVERVELSDREPFDNRPGGSFGWHKWHSDGRIEDPDDLPPALWDALEGYNGLDDDGPVSAYKWFASLAAALSALSLAAVNLGRQRAGLPPLAQPGV